MALGPAAGLEAALRQRRPRSLRPRAPDLRGRGGRGRRRRAGLRRLGPPCRGPVGDGLVLRRVRDLACERRAARCRSAAAERPAAGAGRRSRRASWTCSSSSHCTARRCAEAATRLRNDRVRPCWGTCTTACGDAGSCSQVGRRAAGRPPGRRAARAARLRRCRRRPPTIRRTTVSPRPLPRCRSRVERPRKKRSNTCASSSGGIPGPSSSTPTSTHSPSGVREHDDRRAVVGDRAQRVAGEVDEHLLEAAGRHERECGLRLGAQRRPRGGGQRGEARDRVVDGLNEVDALGAARCVPPSRAASRYARSSSSRTERPASRRIRASVASSRSSTPSSMPST